jgi:hypothetical protein
MPLSCPITPRAFTIYRAAPVSIIMTSDVSLPGDICSRKCLSMLAGPSSIH